MRTAIITDSNSGVTAQEAQRLGVWVVPMPIIVDSRTRFEGVDLFAEEFYRLLAQGHSVSTSQPAPGDLTGLWDRVLAEGWDEIVYIPMSSGLSSSCQTAAVLAAAYGGRVQVADNHQISVPQKNAVRDAAALAAAGLPAAEIRRRLEEAGGDSLIYIGVDTLEYLKRGGRITPAAAAVGSLLHIKPLLTIRGEKLDIFAKVRGVRRCKERLLEAMAASAAEYRRRGVPIRVDAAGTFTDPAEEREWLDLAARTFPGEEIGYDPLTLSVGAHTGPGAFAMGISRRIEP